MRSPRMRLIALAAVPALLLGACSSSDDAPEEADVTSGPEATAPEPHGDLADVSIDESDGAPALLWNDAPLAEGELPFAVEETVTEPVSAGDGELVEEGHEVQVNFLMANGASGETVMSTWVSERPVTMDLNDSLLFPAFLNELPGREIGETFLMAAPQSDAYGSEGNPDVGFEKFDTALFYVEVVSSSAPLTQAEGAPVEPAEGLPQVEADGVSEAVITIGDEVESPEETVAQVLIQGEGAEVLAGQQIKVHYTGVSMADGEQFDSSYSRDAPTTFQIGVGAVIGGWDSGLVGQNVGSRVLLVIPATEAYGEDPEAHQLGGQDLVFVVDILGAY